MSDLCQKQDAPAPEDVRRRRYCLDDLSSMYLMTSPTVCNFSASSSGTSTPNSSSKAITSSTISSESAPKSSMNDAVGVTCSGFTPSCSTMISFTFSSIGLSDIKFSPLALCEGIVSYHSRQASQLNELAVLSINFRPNRLSPQFTSFAHGVRRINADTDTNGGPARPANVARVGQRAGASERLCQFRRRRIGAGSPPPRFFSEPRS